MKQLINEGTLKNYEILLEIGYENSSYFTKMFKRLQVCLPRSICSMPFMIPPPMVILSM